MFFYLLKNSTIIEPELDENSRNTKILIYGTVAYIVLHATLFIGGEEALLNCLKPYFWLFVFLDIGIISINSEIDINKLLNLKTTSNINNVASQPVVNVGRNEEQLNNVFDSFLKNSEIDGNQQIKNRGNSSIPMGNPHIKRKNIVKKVRFNDKYNDEYQSSSSDSDIGTDIDIESFKESLNSI
jgi:hypothetical protein